MPSRHDGFEACRAVSSSDRFVRFDAAAARACGFEDEVFNVGEESLIAADLLDLTPGGIRKTFAGNTGRLMAGRP